MTGSVVRICHQIHPEAAFHGQAGRAAGRAGDLRAHRGHPCLGQFLGPKARRSGTAPHLGGAASRDEMPLWSRSGAEGHQSPRAPRRSGPLSPCSVFLHGSGRYPVLALASSLALAPPLERRHVPPRIAAPAPDTAKLPPEPTTRFQPRRHTPLPADQGRGPAPDRGAGSGAGGLSRPTRPTSPTRSRPK